MAEKVNINIEDRDKLVEIFGKINIEGYDHDVSSEYALFTRLLKLKSIRENYNMNNFIDILNFYVENGLCFNDNMSTKKDMSSKIYSFLTYSFSHPENAKKDANTILKRVVKRDSSVIEAQSEVQAEEKIKTLKNKVLIDMYESLESGAVLSDYEDPDFIQNGIGCEKCISGYIKREDNTWGFCDCYIREILKTKYRKAGLPDNSLKYLKVQDELVDFCAIKNYSKEDTNFKGIALSQYINRYKTNIENLFKEGWNLIIEGPPGSLKTTTACLLGKYAIQQNYSVLFVEMQQLRKIWTGEVLTAELEELKKNIYTVDLLILDDFGQEFMSANSDYQLSELDYLLRTRFSNNKKVILTTNATKEQIEKRYSLRISSLLNTRMMHLFIKTKQDLRKNSELPDFF